MILNDPYAGHRMWWHEDQTGDVTTAHIWTEWDFLLLRAYQYIEDFTTPNGHLAWIEEDHDVGWDVQLVESGFDRAMHDYREAHEVKPYQTLRAKPIWESDVEAPSLEKWLQRLEEESEGGFPAMPEGGTPRPPTAEELLALSRPPEENDET